MSISKPMLAVAVKDPASIKFPVLATPKLDGIRCLVVGGQALSRKFKPIPNHYIRNWIEANCPDGFDGEIMAGNTFNECQSLVMSEDGEPVFNYVVFDYVAGDLSRPYHLRIEDLRNFCGPNHFYPNNECNYGRFVTALYPIFVNNLAELEELETMWLKDGYEGVMIRSLDGPYKCNRSTLKEGYLLKVKRFTDAEAIVIGMEELMHNDNPAEVGELGQIKRSSHKANLRPSGMMGVLNVRDIKTGVDFSVGTGFTEQQRKEFWSARKMLTGRTITYVYQESGMKDKPRFPSFKGFRHENDI